jgi:hypothetical protein
MLVTPSIYLIAVFIQRCLAPSAVAFKVYDVDRDGFISNGELFLVLKMMVGNNLKVRGRTTMSSRCPEIFLICHRTNNCNKLSTRPSWRQTRMAMAN